MPRLEPPKELLAHFYPWLKRSPCLMCGNLGSEVAHLKAFIDTGTLLERPRSHVTVAALSCIPLCPGDHRAYPDSLHNTSEAAFIKRLDEKYGEGFTYKYVAGQLAEFLVEVWDALP